MILPIHDNQTQAATSNSRSQALVDQHHRRIDHLRISITDRCDLKCVYCRPDGDAAIPHSQTLSLNQRVALVEMLAARYGLTEIRITGGEPLVEPTAVAFVAALREALPSITLKMTTNARRLSAFAAPLRDAGLNRLNISLDSINPDTYRNMTGGNVTTVRDGIAAARFAGFPPPRINVVTLRDWNDHEVVDMVAWALHEKLELRFLEPMPIGPVATRNELQFVSAAEVRARLSREYELTSLPREMGATARCYRVNGDDVSGTIGFIAPITEPFCSDCRRMRITADGHMYPCLLDSRNVDLRPALQNDKWDEARLAELIETTIAKKAAVGPQLQATSMITLGG